MFTKRSIKLVASSVAISFTLTSCATLDNAVSENSNYFSCGLGALAGAAVGAATASVKGKDARKYGLVGAVVGCGAGLLYKARVDRLKAIAQEEGLAMSVDTVRVVNDSGRSKIVEAGIAASVESSAMFPISSAVLTTSGKRQVKKMAEVIADIQPGKQASPKKVLVVGHTDATGTARFNQTLSEKRAKAVASILKEAGIKAEDIYFQGAGASKPIADNSTKAGRSKNRRVEIVEVTNQEILQRLVNEDRNNPRYLAHGTRHKVSVKAVSPTNKMAATEASKMVVQAPVIREPVLINGENPQSGSNKSGSKVVETLPADKAIKLAGNGFVDFGGSIVRTTSSTLVQGLKPARSSFSLISAAYADQPVSSCLADMPRTSGEIKNLATGKSVDSFRTTDYMIGMNGRSWGQGVNGHVVSFGPVAILKDAAKVAAEPDLQFITNYKSNGKETPVYKAVANTYAGEGEVLYRVFAIDQSKSPVSCMDIVFDTLAGVAKAGELFYPKNGDAFVVSFVPVRK